VGAKSVEAQDRAPTIIGPETDASKVTNTCTVNSAFCRLLALAFTPAINIVIAVTVFIVPPPPFGLHWGMRWIAGETIKLREKDW
jgi:hypothetical protein